jgi:Enoyl-(Acyl carrier protein) reductase/Phosphotransferase enzyme family
VGGHVVTVDVTAEAAVEQALTEAESRHGIARVLVNCAGIGPPAKVIDREGKSLPLVDFTKMVTVHLLGSFKVLSNSQPACAKSKPPTRSAGSSSTRPAFRLRRTDWPGRLRPTRPLASKSHLPGCEPTWGNLLLAGNSISGILDWELAHEGHPAQDLAYCRLQVEQVMPWSEFLRIYEDHGGASVSEDVVRYFQIYGYTFGLSTVFPMIDGYARGKFEDFLLGSISFIEGVQCADYVGRTLLEEFRHSGVISGLQVDAELKNSAFSNFL